ncbi:patatin family protein [Ornithinibacillus sp. L9]|uniref:Patatin family protein n=1 Tax=Ornithinibacillus caprae TaxID=2678566 RepID=A0A6N8FJ35_9BACI|nr:patatin family protein [Ornithinibacillus caprae]MUK89251.1 patatin family protein [Ornithinibacillus caprae]
MKYNANLVLEGGGMRGAYTAGVLDFFHDQGIEFPLVTSTSSAALVGSSYIAKQRGRNYKILEQIWKNSQSISFLRMLQHKELFSMDFIFNTLSNDSFPIDFDTLSKTPTKFVIGTTDMNTGKPFYFDHYETKSDLLNLIRASCSLPVLAPSVSYKNKELMDGGISDAIPINPSIASGTPKHVVVLTRNQGYVKKPSNLHWLFKRVFKDYPNFINLLKTRHNLYNQTMQMLLKMEQQGEVFIIQPQKPLKASRIERNKDKLRLLYMQGYEEAENKLKDLQRFLKNSDQSYYFQDNISS